MGSCPLQEDELDEVTRETLIIPVIIRTLNFSDHENGAAPSGNLA